MVNSTNFTSIVAKSATKGIINGLLYFWWFFVFIIAFSLLMRYLKSAKFKGKMGELGAYLGMLTKLDSNKYKIFNDIKITDQLGKTQIDHIVVSKYGIFVIEVKNYQGWIYANEKEKFWTQNIYGKRTKFYNPLWQNYRHIKALSEYLGLDTKYLHSIVFFNGNVTFRTPVPPM